MAYKNEQKGFTVIEVMIALMVFSSMMVIVLAGVIFVSRQYQQSSNAVSLEEASRVIHQQISDSIKFSSSDVILKTNSATGWSTYCVGKTMYIFPSGSNLGWTGTDIDFNSLKEGLFVRPNDNNCDMNDINVTNTDTNLTNILPPGAKVTKFQIVNSQQVSTVFARSPGDLLDIPPVTSPNVGEVNCRSNISGREFCATVKLTSNAIRRTGT